MKTQGISLNVSAMQSLSTGKSTKVKESAFDSFMAGTASGATVKKQNSFAGKQQDVKTGKEGSNINSSSDEFNRHKISLTAEKPKSDVWTETADIEEISEDIVSFLKDTFGMSEEDIVDILEQLGLSAADLAFSLSADWNQVTLINVENIKAFIMEAHGVEDANLFLTSDIMSGELTDIMAGIQDILEESMGMDLESFLQSDNVLLQSFAEKLGQMLNQPEQAAGEQKTDDAALDLMQNAAASGTEDEIPVVVETSEDSGLSDLYQNSQQARTENVRQDQAESPLNAFVERLTQSFETVGTTETVSQDVTMTDIVQQVVNHIRIRVLPQTTSMELQLNPESLGRVNLNVTSNNGTATATLTVQNQMAKEALESQIAVLKENLESQGLKVESVEVNVSDFGFKHPEDSNNNQFGQQQQKKAPGKRFRFDAADEVEEESAADSADAVQTGDSVVDYTA